MPRTPPGPASKRGLSVTIFSVTRLNNSVNGNPRYALDTDHGRLLTSSNTQAAYEVPNVTAPLRPGRFVEARVSLTHSGLIYEITPL